MVSLSFLCLGQNIDAANLARRRDVRRMSGDNNLRIIVGVLFE